MADYDGRLLALFDEFVRQVELEYKELYAEIGETFKTDGPAAYRAEHSVRLAEASGVTEDKIIRNTDRLDDLFL